MRNRTLYSGLQALFSPGAVWPFLIGAAAVGVLGNAVYDLLLALFCWNFSAADWSTFFVLILSIIVLIGAAWFFSRIIDRLQPLPPITNTQAPHVHKGLILLVSREEPCRKAIDYHSDHLVFCRFIYSTKSADIATKLAAELKSRGIDADVELVLDVLNPLEIQGKVEAIYDNLPAGLQEADVIVDFTGMTAVASVGAVLGCVNRPRHIEYVPAVYDDEGRGIRSYEDPIEIVFNNQRPSASPQPTPAQT